MIMHVGMLPEIIDPKHDKYLWVMLENTIKDVMKRGYSYDQAFIRVPYEFVKLLPQIQIDELFNDLYKYGIVSAEEFYEVKRKNDSNYLKIYHIREYIERFIGANEHMRKLIYSNEMKGYNIRKRKSASKSCNKYVCPEKMF